MNKKRLFCIVILGLLISFSAVLVQATETTYHCGYFKPDNSDTEISDWQWCIYKIDGASVSGRNGETYKVIDTTSTIQTLTKELSGCLGEFTCENTQCISVNDAGSQCFCSECTDDSECDEGYVCQSSICNIVCTDPDEGADDIYTKTTVTGKMPIGDEITSSADSCFTNNYYAQECSGDDCSVFEFICGEEERVASKLVECPNGCSNGACLGAGEEEITCTDPDEGADDIYTKTTVTGKMLYSDEQTSSTDSCFKDYYTSECSGEGCKIYEVICDGDTVSSKWTDCPNGCVNGACLRVAEEDEEEEEENETITNETIEESEPYEPETGEGCRALECEVEGKCYPLGYRSKGTYCNESDVFAEQKETGVCENHFECKSNLCTGDNCLERGFFQKIIDFFRKLFG